jgi:hypothetical protein
MRHPAIASRSNAHCATPEISHMRHPAIAIREFRLARKATASQSNAHCDTRASRIARVTLFLATAAKSPVKVSHMRHPPNHQK